MELSRGQQLVHYRLVEKLGEGGMGLVWKALDTKLDREVAIKFLPEAFAADSDRVTRFQREAKLLASLNQPNIAAIYGFEQIDGLSFLVMELVPGEDLACRLARGALPMDAALECCCQIALALEAAHDSGVIHRDLKPANVHVTPDETIKVLDFGLAKASDPSPASGDPALSPTMTSAGTVAGVILGTAGYMSPEQARGKPLDKRTDIWSFGCVLYECLTGRRAFGGETISDTLASVLTADPGWEELPGATHPRVRELLGRCLVKDVRQRQRDIGDVRLELERVRSGEAGELPFAPGATAAPAGRNRLALAFISALLGAALGIAAWVGLSGAGGSSTNAVVSSLSVTLPDGEVDTFRFPHLSPDGSRVVYSTHLEGEFEVEATFFVRDLDSFEAKPIDGMYGVGHVSISPDSASLLYVGTETDETRKRFLFKRPLNGSRPPLALIDWNAEWSHPVFASEDELVVFTGTPLRIVTISANGSGDTTEQDIPAGQFDGALVPQGGLPGGKHLLCRLTTTDDRGYLHHVMLLNLETGKLRMLIEDGSYPSLTSTGHLLFTRHDTLLAAPFDVNSMEVTGPAVTVRAGLRASNTWIGAIYSVSKNGTLMYLPGGVTGAQRRLVTIATDGSVEDWSPDRRAFMNGNPTISADETKVAVSLTNETGLDEVWVADSETRTLRRWIAETGKDCGHFALSPEADRIVYGCGGTESGQIYIAPFDESSAPRLLFDVTVGGPVYPGMEFWPDGTKLLYGIESGGLMDIRMLDLVPGPNGELEDTPLLSDVESALVSPDGNWLGSMSDTSGRPQLSVRRIDENDQLGREIHVPSDAGIVGFWWRRRDAATLVYGDEDGQFHSATVHETGISEATREPWNVEGLKDIAGWAELADGRLLAVLQDESEKPTREYRLVLNFTEELKHKLGSN